MGPFALALLLSAPVHAGVIDVGARRVLQWVDKCVGEVNQIHPDLLGYLNTEVKVLQDVCLEAVQEPCQVVFMPYLDQLKEEGIALPGRCERLCGEDGKCKGPPPLVNEAGWEEKTGPTADSFQRDAAKPEAPKDTWGWISASLKNECHDAKGRPIQGQRLGGSSGVASLAWGSSYQLRQKPEMHDDPHLRNAEHYLYSAFDTVNGKWRRGWTVAQCTLSYGYTAVKFVGPLRTLLGKLNDDGKEPTPPTWEEADWGCRGASDVAEGAFQRVAKALCPGLAE